VYVAVVGPGPDASQRDCERAREVGRLLAERGICVLTGGLSGVMAAAAEGCSQAGGISIGLLPGTDREAVSPHLTIALPTGLGELRNGLLVRSSDGIVAVGGSWGTLSEVALAHRLGVPVVTLHGWSVWDAAGGAIPMITALSPLAAVERVVELIEHQR
jgi:uncharacterized protein (TIGR00725 family)